MNENDELAAEKKRSGKRKMNVTAYLTPIQHQRLQKLADMQNRSLSNELAYLVDEAWRKQEAREK